MYKVSTISALNELMNETMVYAVIVFVVAVALAWLVSRLIPWEGGKDRSYVKRRIAFIIIGIVAVLGFWLYNDQVVMNSISKPGFQAMFSQCNLKCLGITAGGYLVLSLIIMFCFRYSKFGSILGLGRDKK